MIKPTFIYALCEPGTAVVRYIGKSDNPKKRFLDHLRAGQGTHKGHWILKLAALGLIPSLEILDEVPHFQWKFFERAYIKVYREAGFQLTNATDGGEGISNMSLELRDKIRVTKIGSRASNETRAKMSAAQKGRTHRPEALARMSSAQKGRVVSLEARAKLRTANLGKVASLETRANMRAAWTPEKRAALGVKQKARIAERKKQIV